MPVHLKDIAQVAKVSPGTASKVLNGRSAEIRISESTRKRVFQAARKLNYQPNHTARSLRMRQTHTIGVIVHGEGDCSRQIKLAEQYASQRGYELLLAISRWDSHQEESQVRRLMRRGVDGLLILAPVIEGPPDKILDELVERNFPFVGFGPTLAEGADFVDWDRTEAFAQLTEHLLGRGVRKLAFLGWGMTPGIEQRIAGIRRAMQNVQGAELQRLGCDDEAKGMHIEQLPDYLRDKFRKDQPHAVLCQGDDLALVAMSVARDLGLTVPNDLAVTGNGDAIFTRVMDVPITSVSLPYENMIDIALLRIIEKIEHPDHVLDRMQTYVPAEVILRQSSLFGNKLS